ncbi:hypothetical protein Scep_022408 [Stephania cephalantha]|uniref:Uncharacterized protein n=1 Tax=Stephania cephalantha TaxID=152367 RepID=A0AAP0FHF9_9MAGN
MASRTAPTARLRCKAGRAARDTARSRTRDRMVATSQECGGRRIKQIAACDDARSREVARLPEKTTSSGSKKAAWQRRGWSDSLADGSRMQRAGMAAMASMVALQWWQQSAREQSGATAM